MSGTTLDQSVTEDTYYTGCLAAKSLTDGTRREVHLLKMIFNLRLSCTSEPHGMYYEEQYCYQDFETAWSEFEKWDGDTEPKGWFKNLQTGEYSGVR